MIFTETGDGLGESDLYPSLRSVSQTLTLTYLRSMRTIVFLSLSVVLVLLSGCKDKSRPSDFPDVFSVSITITQEDKPLEGATVTLIAKTPSQYGTASGTTDASGVAKLRTYGHDGVPAGDYAVLVTKQGVENAKESKTLEGLPIMVGGENYQYVDGKFSKESTTTHSISVTNKGAKETFDVGAAVRVFVSKNEE